MTYENLKDIADFVPEEQLITKEVFGYPKSIGDAKNLSTIGSLLDSSFSNPDRTSKDDFVFLINTLLKEIEKPYCEQNFIADFIFFPVLCPKFINTHKEHLYDIYRCIKDVTNFIPILIIQTHLFLLSIAKSGHKRFTRPFLPQLSRRVQ